MSDFISQNIGFFLKVVFTHAITYTLCGIIFYKLNNYKDLIAENKGIRWRSQRSLIFRLAPVFQILRGILFGIVLLIIRDVVVDTSFGFLKLFFILATTGLINVYQPAVDSIEGFIYMEPEKGLTFKEIIGGNIEVLTQILLFSIIVTTNWGELVSRLFG